MILTRKKKPTHRNWGGARPGAGRPRILGPERSVPHLVRAPHAKSDPVHLTMRRSPDCPKLRQKRLLVLAMDAIAAASSESFRVLCFSMQSERIELIVEAKDGAALRSGGQGLAVRLARGFNRVLRRTGKVWLERFGTKELRTPEEVRAALVYVLMNHKKHDDARGAGALDPFSSAGWFDGFTAKATPLLAALRERDESPVAQPRTALARTGWRAEGLIDPSEEPPPDPVARRPRSS